MDLWLVVNGLNKTTIRLQGESFSLYWLTKGKKLCEGIPSWTQLYCQIYNYLNYILGGCTLHLVWNKS